MRSMLTHVQIYYNAFKSDGTIIKALSPLIIFLKISFMILFGISDVETDESINYYGKSNLLLYLYQLAYMLYGIDNTIAIFGMSPDDSTVSKIYCYVFALNAWSLIVVNFIWDLYHNNRFLALLRRIYHIDQLLHKNEISLDYRYLRNFSAVVISTEALCYLGFNIECVRRYWAFGLTYFQIFILFMYFTGLHMMQVCMTAKSFTLFLTVENIFFNINKKLRTDDTTVDLISATRRLYENVYNMVLDLNEEIAFQLVVPFCVTFVMAVFHIYYEMTLDHMSGTAMLIWMAALLLKICVVIVQIQRAMMAAEEIKRTLFQLGLVRDRQLRKEINMFSLQLLHQKINISGAKFFDINMSLLMQFFGKGLQYLLLLYQTR